MVPAGYINQVQLAQVVEQAIAKLGPEVVRVRHRVGADTSGEAAIFFRIVLADWAAAKNTSNRISHKIVTTLIDEIRPLENWGLFPYFSFRSNAEQSLRSDPEWT